jgi:hypothetical protein
MPTKAPILNGFTFAEKVALRSEEQPQRLKAGLILWHLRRGLKPRPFKTKSTGVGGMPEGMP